MECIGSQCELYLESLPLHSITPGLHMEFMWSNVEFHTSKWTPCGVQSDLESMWSPRGVCGVHVEYVESIRSPCGVHQNHLESMWSPPGIKG
jgi:hypothetical protein